MFYASEISKTNGVEYTTYLDKINFISNLMITYKLVL